MKSPKDYFVKLNDFEKFLWDSFNCNKSHYFLIKFVEYNCNSFFKKMSEEKFDIFDFDCEIAFKIVKKLSSLSRKVLKNKLLKPSCHGFQPKRQSYALFDSSGICWGWKDISLSDLDKNGSLKVNGITYTLDISKNTFPVFVEVVFKAKNSDQAIISHASISPIANEKNLKKVVLFWSGLEKDNF